MGFRGGLRAQLDRVALVDAPGRVEDHLTVEADCAAKRCAGVSATSSEVGQPEP